jgi:hypothetical protein
MPLADIRRSLAAQVGGDLCRQKVISRHKSTRHKSPQQDSTLEEPQQKALPAFVVLGGSSRPNFVGMKNYQGTRFQEDATLRPNLTRVCEHSSLYALPRHCPTALLRSDFIILRFRSSCLGVLVVRQSSLTTERQDRPRSHAAASADSKLGGKKPRSSTHHQGSSIEYQGSSLMPPTLATRASKLAPRAYCTRSTNIQPLSAIENSGANGLTFPFFAIRP